MEEATVNRDLYKPRRHGMIYDSTVPDDVIANIPISLVYEWVRTGKWNRKHFDRWLRSIRVIE